MASRRKRRSRRKARRRRQRGRGRNLPKVASAGRALATRRGPTESEVASGVLGFAFLILWICWGMLGLGHLLVSAGTLALVPWRSLLAPDPPSEELPAEQREAGWGCFLGALVFGAGAFVSGVVGGAILSDLLLWHLDMTPLMSHAALGALLVAGFRSGGEGGGARRRRLEEHGVAPARVRPRVRPVPLPGDGVVLEWDPDEARGEVPLPEDAIHFLGEVEDALPDDESPTCQFCGEAVAPGRAVRCLRCETPHHRDCWRASGACTTFGCGGRRAG